jgi:hypothetical protein
MCAQLGVFLALASVRLGVSGGCALGSGKVLRGLRQAGEVVVTLRCEGRHAPCQLHPFTLRTGDLRLEP